MNKLGLRHNWDDTYDMLHKPRRSCITDIREITKTVESRLTSLFSFSAWLPVFSTTLLRMPSQLPLPFFTAPIPKFSSIYTKSLPMSAVWPHCHRQGTQSTLRTSSEFWLQTNLLLQSSFLPLRGKVGFTSQSLQVNFHLYTGTCFFPIPKSWVVNHFFSLPWLEE